MGDEDDWGQHLPLGRVVPQDVVSCLVAVAARSSSRAHAQAVLQHPLAGASRAVLHLEAFLPEDPDPPDREGDPAAALQAALADPASRPQCVVAADFGEPGTVYVGVSTGSGLGDFLSLCQPVKVSEGVMAHRGVLQAARQLLQPLQAALKPLGAARVMFCGHGFGGGAALLLAHLAQGVAPGGPVVTFGAPAVVGHHRADPELGVRIRAFVLGADLLPRLLGSAAVGQLAALKALCAACSAFGGQLLAGGLPDFVAPDMAAIFAHPAVPAAFALRHGGAAASCRNPRSQAGLFSCSLTALGAEGVAHHSAAVYLSAVAETVLGSAALRCAAELSAAAPAAGAVAAAEQQWAAAVAGDALGDFRAKREAAGDWQDSVDAAERSTGKVDSVDAAVDAGERDKLLHSQGMHLCAAGTLAPAEVAAALSARARRSAAWARQGFLNVRYDLCPLESSLKATLDATDVLVSQKPLLLAVLALLYNARACLSRRQGKLRPALKDLKFAVASDPSCAEAQSNLSALTLKSGLLSEALSYAREASRLVAAAAADGSDDEDDGEDERAAVQLAFPVDTPVVTVDGLKGIVRGHYRGRVGIELPTGSKRGIIPARLRIAPKQRFPKGSTVETADGLRATVVGHYRGRVGIELADGERRGVLPDTLGRPDDGVRVQGEGPEGDAQRRVDAAAVAAACLHNFVIACAHLQRLAPAEAAERDAARQRLGRVLGRLRAHPVAAAIRISLQKIPAGRTRVVQPKEAAEGPQVSSPGMSPRMRELVRHNAAQPGSQQQQGGPGSPGSRPAPRRSRLTGAPGKPPAGGPKRSPPQRVVYPPNKAPAALYYASRASSASRQNASNVPALPANIPEVRAQPQPAVSGRLPPLLAAPPGMTPPQSLPGWAPSSPLQGQALPALTYGSPTSAKRTVASPGPTAQGSVISATAALRRLPPDQRPRPSPLEREFELRQQRLREARWNDDPCVHGHGPHRQWVDRETLLADAAAATAEPPAWSKRTALAAESVRYKEGSRRRSLEQEQQHASASLQDRQSRGRLRSLEQGPRQDIIEQESRASRQASNAMASERQLIAGQVQLQGAVGRVMSALKREEEDALDPIRDTDARLRVLSEEAAKRHGYSKMQLHEWDVLLREAEQAWLEITWVRKKPREERQGDDGDEGDDQGGATRSP